MRRRTLGVKKEPTIMIIPMIDIVFFLLVFFMVGTLYIDNQEISLDRLAQEVKSIVTQAPQQAFVIRASKDVYYNDVIELLDMLKVNGAKYISVATERK